MQEPKSVAILERNLDSLTVITVKLKNTLDYLEKEIPGIIISNSGGNSSIRLFRNFGLNISLSHQRPSFNPETFLCVPGAYTSIDNKIDGLFIENGVEINNQINIKLTGMCIIMSDSIQILKLEEMKPDMINKIKISKHSFFQQTLLVRNSKIAYCELFGNIENKRRALIQFNDSYCIGESNVPMSIGKFQESLIGIGAVNAINLDMATWSEGWYKNQCCEKKIIGENMINTQKQTNWIVFTKN